MPFEKPYTKSENVILRKHNPKGFSQKISIFVSFDDFIFNYGEKCGRYTTNRNHTQSHRCSHQIQFPNLLYNHLLSCRVIYIGSWLVLCNTLSSVKPFTLETGKMRILFRLCAHRLLHIWESQFSFTQHSQQNGNCIVLCDNMSPNKSGSQNDQQ